MEILKRLFGRRQAPSDTEDLDDFDWFNPPSDVSSPDAWDEYWRNQLSHGLGPEICSLFCDDRSLIDVMRHAGFRTALCVGSGISYEPRALARAGLIVDALDLSPFAMKWSEADTPKESALDDVVGSGTHVPGGQVRYVVGDLTDTSICPGPYDVVIERLTVQLFPGSTRAAAYDALRARLAPEGILFTHAHNGGWRPTEPRLHPGEPVLQASGWRLWSGRGEKPPGQVAWLFFSTG